MRFLYFLILLLIAIYLAGLLLVYTQQRKMMYFPPAAYLSPTDVGLPNAVELPLRSENGDALLAWWLPPQTGEITVMYFHGNGSAVYSGYETYRELSEQGYGVLGVAYPGYPGSDGDAGEKALVSAAQAQYDFLIAEGISADKIVFYGTSLGAGVAAQLSKTRKPPLMIMEAPFTSALDIGRSQMKIYPVGLLMKDKFLSADTIKGSGIPILWIHGTSDNVIPFTMGQSLYDTYDGPKTAHAIEGGGHNDLWFRGGRQIVMDALFQFSNK